MQLKHEKAVASRNVGSAAAWALPQEVFTMQTKRFLIPAVAALGLTLCALPSIANAGAGMAGANDLASQGKSNVTLVRGFGGGFHGGGFRGGGFGGARFAGVGVGRGFYGGGLGRGWGGRGWGWRGVGWRGGGWGWRRGWGGGGWGWPVGAGLVGLGVGLGYPGWGYGWGTGYPAYSYGGCGW
jgi:hypothetical protein